ncbi:MAG: carboxypeptidase-like regulatory domain-containing protein [Flavobacterium sp.]
MKNKQNLILFFFLFVGYLASAQIARIQGIVLSEFNKPIENVSVRYLNTGVSTNENGYYSLKVPAGKKITLEFSHITLKKASATFMLKPNENFEFNIVLKENIEQFNEVVITAKNRKRIEGLVSIEPSVIRNIPGANPGVENILKSFGASSNNELSTQYSVRGGNFDENLVYVNEIEIYRPFLVRSGQQEGLSFTNTDMVQNVDFSAGGFQSKYGDKLSSVLDITYRTPTKFGVSGQASLLGGSLTAETASKNQKWNAITGIRYRDNSLLVKSQDTKTNYHPRFADIQAYITYTPSIKWQWSFLGNISQNVYDYTPTSRVTKFGTIDQPQALVVDYQGKENDKYSTYFGALKSVYKVNDNFVLKFLGSVYHTLEQEYYDILAGYGFGQLNTSDSQKLGDVEFVTKIGNELNHGRNDLDALISNAEIKGIHEFERNKIEWGAKYTYESIRDRVVEWQVIDSAGFSINPPIINLPKKDEPYTPYTGPLVPYQNIRATNVVNTNRISGYVQWSRRDFIGEHEIWYNAGVRVHDWQVESQNVVGKNQIIVSPRAQFTIKPAWEKDMIFRISGGVYQQPPFYRELRGYDGMVNPDVKAQKSIHFVLGNDYSFKMWERPFKLISELYYKSMTDVNPYTLENVRIRYAAANNAVAYAKGFDVRLNGDFVPGTESWLSFGYMKNEENIENKGFIARPTDQRLKFGVLFQDFMPQIPSVKFYLNLVYNTGLPGGSPSYSDPYMYQLRLPDYKRADAGFSYVFTENNKFRPENHWLRKFKDMSIGFEIYNLFDNQNAITNTWVRDVYTKTQYAVPNYLTTRVFNIKFSARL